ncbi:hypothetical protein O181_093338 [Austropuccinia psidii MF-1]|uniref:Reverse transcriptase domain-containing protein n=1 Tax=Austropuccinia psidii MF-1 TaxID=1389203 RepID=A0A9Q3P985_9BASI|nr:hypothetical protein [Austropuccinia psidii MF-1]
MDDLSIFNINDQLKILKDHILEISENTNQFATHLEKSDSERQKLKDEIIANVEQIHNNYEPLMPRQSTPLTEKKRSVEGSLTPLLGGNVISEKDNPKLEEWPTLSGEGKYNHIEFIRTINMFQEDFNIPYEIIVGKLHCLFTRTAKKWYYKMRIDHGNHDWSWWKSEVITKWENNSWRFKMENAFESAIFNSEKHQPLTWFFNKKDRLSALHPDMSDTMINMKILRKCGGELEHAIKSRCVEPCSTEDYINAMEDIITRTRTGKTWTKKPMESKLVSKITREERRPEKPVLKFHKCGSTSNSSNSCTKKTKINEVEIIEEIHCTEEKEESDQDSEVFEYTPVEDYTIENITDFFEVTEVHTHLPQYGEDFHNLINIKDSRMCKTKPAKGKGYTAGASCMTSILMNGIEAKVNLDTGAFCTCVGNNYLQVILPEWENHLLPIEGAIKEHEVDITLNIDIPYPPVLRRPAYPASPRAREALEKRIQELIQLGFLRKVGHSEEVEVTTPVIIAWHNDKSRMVGDFRELNTYTVPDRYPIPRIGETLTQWSKSKYITSIDALKGFHQNVLTPKAKKLLRIITHCGIYEYHRMPFGIENAPSHYQRLINTILPTELSEGWLIIYIDDIIICSDSWSLHLERLAKKLQKAAEVNIKILLKK